MRKTFKLQTKTFSIIALSVLITGLASCSKNNVPNVSTPASLNIINSAETSAPQDFYLDNAKVNATALAYTQSSGYVQVDASVTHTGQFKTSSTNTSNVYFDATFQGGSYYSVYYTDDKTASGTQDDKTAPQTGNARVRFINLSKFANSNFTAAVTGGAALISNLQYQTFSTYYEVTAAAVLSLNLSGTAAVQLSIPATVLQAGHVYTIYVSGTTQATVTYHVVTEV